MKKDPPSSIENRLIKCFPEEPPAIKRVSADSLVRAHHTGGHALKNIIHVGTSRYRYCDHVAIARFATTYAAKNPMPGLAEARGLVLNKSLRQIVLNDRYVKNYAFSRLHGTAQLRMLPFTELVPLLLDIVDDIRRGEDGYLITQALAAAIWTKWPDVDGIMYTSRLYNPAPCFAIFDRAIARRGLIVTSTTAVLDESDIQAALKTGKIILETKY